MSELEAPAGRTADLAYVTVTDDIAARIASGELQPGARLLAERELAGHYGVAYGTIRRAMMVVNCTILRRSVPELVGFGGCLDRVLKKAFAAS